MATNIAVLSNPSLPSASKKPRASRGKYTFYMPKNHAEIGKYAIENGNVVMREQDAIFWASFQN